MAGGGTGASTALGQMSFHLKTRIRSWRHDPLSCTGGVTTWTENEKAGPVRSSKVCEDFRVYEISVY